MRDPSGTVRAARTDLMWIAACLAWILAVLTGFGVLWRYKMQVGEAAPAPRSWPQGSTLQRSPDRATLVLFAHPQCPCTRASVGVLADLLARARDHAVAWVVFVKPNGEPAGWERTDLWNSAARIPGVRVAVDEGGAEAARFGAATSGLTVLYDPAGRLQFAGGITASRGHAGESFGSRRILSFISTGRADRADAPVFGCAFAGPARAVADAREDP